MALRDQPYLPLYVQDFMTDEKLSECSAESTGVYIRLLCILHKQETYGSILLKQKYKQNDKQTKNFASMLARQMPYESLVIERSLDELLYENVIQIDGEYLSQKRMVKDGELSDKRASAGSKGGKIKIANDFAIAKKQANVKANQQAKPLANTEIEVVVENEYENDIPVVHPCLTYCEQNLMSMSDGNYSDLREFIADGMPDELIIYAVDEASAQGKRTWAYVRSMLNRWLIAGIRTIGEAKADSDKFKAQLRPQVPPGRASPPEQGKSLEEQFRVVG